MMNRILAVGLIVAGIVWSCMFPKSASFRPDMVASVAIGVGLVGAGVIVNSSDRRLRSTSLLLVLLLWSMLANVYFIAWSHSVNTLLWEREHLKVRQSSQK